STDPRALVEELLIDVPIEDAVMFYAKNAAMAGLDGVVCSPLEAGDVHRCCGQGFLAVTPGVRFAEGGAGDQVRVATPERARELGSDLIVVGRPITRAADPVAAWKRCVREFLG
ncbi:MAG: orotidine 5'-phosphate decarboxylase, partial [Mailhella sp.]|nr:orotidine 5'-phosphate decarboxylase [Mailhella sp.]